MVPLAIGSDGGGSIRIPASLCGVAGFKATFGVVPREPQWPGWYSLTHLGPLAFTVADCALMTAVMAGPGSARPDLAARPRRRPGGGRAATGDLRGLRVAYSEDLGYIRVDPGRARRIPRAPSSGSASSGAEMERGRARSCRTRSTPGTPSPASTTSSRRARCSPPGWSAADTRELIEAGSAYSAADYVARPQRAGAPTPPRSGRFMERLRPAADAGDGGRRVPARHDRAGGHRGQPIGEHFDDWCHFCYPANLSGAPAISVPMGSGRGRPAGRAAAHRPPPRRSRRCCAPRPRGSGSRRGRGRRSTPLPGRRRSRGIAHRRARRRCRSCCAPTARRTGSSSSRPSRISLRGTDRASPSRSACCRSGRRCSAPRPGPASSRRARRPAGRP